MRTPRPVAQADSRRAAGEAGDLLQRLTFRTGLRYIALAIERRSAKSGPVGTVTAALRLRPSVAPPLDAHSAVVSTGSRETAAISPSGS